MSATAAAQIMRQAEQVKNSMTESGKPFSELWVQRQKLEDLYKKLLLQDLEYALDKKVEQDLWNHAFKNQISNLQTQAKDKENQKKLEAQASLNLFLETASGFYLQFLQMICSTFKLDLPFRRRSAAFGMTQENNIRNKNIVLPKKSSCLYICCHCLVHLGDIARYRQQTEQAQTFYRHAANLSPNNGQPYNQLAILEASRGDKLSTVFYYVRSLAVRHPFPVAATNLEKFYSKLIKDGRSSFDSPTLTVMEIIVAFLQFEALLHMSTDLNRASGLKTKITSSLAFQIKSQSLTAAHLTGIVAIAIFAAHQARCDTTANGEAIKKSVMSEEEEKIVQIHISFIVKLLETLLQQTPKEDNKAKDFLTLPAIKVTFDWLSLNKDVLEGAEFSNTSLWQDFCKLLNTLQWLLNEINKAPDITKYTDTPLPEDADLRCFQPLEPSYNVFNFSKVINEELSPACERDLRCQRLISHGRWVAQDLPKLKLVTFQASKSIRTQFSTRKVASGSSENVQQTHPKSQRQNVAMQTIMKKQLQKKMEQEKSQTSRLSVVSEEGKSQDTKGNPDMSKTIPVSLLSAADINSGAAQGRQIGANSAHHKGNSFKANLPPRLSAKVKTSAISPRMQKKDDPSASRNRSNSNNVTPVTTISNTSASQPTKAEEYPSLNSDNYPALVSQRTAMSLVQPEIHAAADNSINPGGGWRPFGAKHDRGGQGNVSSASSLLFSASVTPSDGMGVPQYTQISQRVSPNDGVVASRDHRPEMSTEHFNPQSEINKTRKTSNQNFPNSRDSVSSADPIRVQNPPPQKQQQQQQQHQLAQRPPPVLTAQDMSQFRQHLPYSQQQQLSQLLAQQQHLQQQQRQILRQPDPNVNLFSQSGMMFDPMQANQEAIAQPPTSLLSSHSTSSGPNNVTIHPRDSSSHALTQAIAAQNTTSSRGGRQPQTVMSAGQSQTSGTSNISGGQASGQIDSSRINSIGAQLMTNPALIGYAPSSGMPAGNVGKKTVIGNPAIPMPGLSYGPGGAARGAGPQPPYFDSSRMNPYQHFQQQQQQQHHHYQQPRPQQQQQQQQQQHRNPMLDKSEIGPPSSTGLLYKNIPLAGSGGGGNKGPPTCLANNVDLGMESGSGMAAGSDFDHRYMSNVPNANQQAQSQALAQLLASQSGFHTDSGRSASFQGHVPGAPKPDLMGLHPSPHFLEQHNHSTKQPQPQPQSLMNTVIDPPFLQASGEYTLFNSANNSPSWQAPLVTAAAPHARLKSAGPHKGSRPGISGPGQADLPSNMGGMWSNSGPSPLERLLQQQRSQRQGDS